MTVVDTIAPDHRVSTGSEPRVLFICPTHWGIRNVVHSGMASSLRAQGLSVYVATASSNSHTNWYPDEAKRDTAKATKGQFLLDTAQTDVDQVIELTTPPRNVTRRGWATLVALQRASYFRRHHIEGDRGMIARYISGSHSRSFWQRTRNLGTEWMSFIASKSPFYGWQNDYMEKLKHLSWDMSAVERQIDQIQPAVVVVTSCAMWVEEPYLMLARERGIPSVGIIQSFDHFSSRSFVAVADYYAVWSQRMKDQLQEFYPDRIPSHIHITGTPQFDFHSRPEFRWSREQTLANLGLNPKDRYILYAATPVLQTPTEINLIEGFAQRCSQVGELKDHRIVVRVHPQDDFTRWDRLKANQSRIVISQPSQTNYRFTNAADQMLLVSSLAYADVTVNTSSTMSLDSAAVDTPIVCVAFAGVPGGDEERFCRLIYKTGFYVPIVASGGVRLANNMNELVEEVKAYVQDRSRDQSQRKNLVASECGPVDGHSAERIADLITSLTRTNVASVVKPA